MACPMGEAKPGPLRVDFDRRLKLEFHGSKIASDAGLLAYRELDQVLGPTGLGGAALSDLRRGKHTRHLLPPILLLQPVRRSGRLPLASRQGTRRRGLAAGFRACGRPLSGSAAAPIFPRGCRFRQARDLRVPGSRRLLLHHLLADQLGLAGADRAFTDPPRRATAAGGSGLSLQLQLPSCDLEQAAPGLESETSDRPDRGATHRERRSAPCHHEIGDTNGRSTGKTVNKTEEAAMQYGTRVPSLRRQPNRLPISASGRPYPGNLG